MGKVDSSFRVPRIMTPRTPSPTVLLVEDDASISLLLQTALAYEELEVVCVATGRAVAKCLEQGPAPALVILDVNLPDMSGLDVLAGMKSSGAAPGVPVLMLSASDRDSDRRRAEQLGATGFVRKPFQLEELVAQVVHIATHAA